MQPCAAGHGEPLRDTVALWMARAKGNHVVLYGDIIFDRAILADLLTTKGQAVLAVDENSELGPEDEKVAIENGRVVRGSKELEPAQSHGEFIGLARFEASATRQLYDAMDARIKSGGMMDFITSTFEGLAQSGLTITPCATERRPWNDNDCLADLDRSRDTVFGEILAIHRARDEATSPAS